MAFINKALLKQYVYFGREAGLWTGAKIMTPLETKLRLVAFSPTVSAALKNACRQNRTTTTAALQVIIAHALLSHLPREFTKLKG
ncbi:hypothetical protein ASPZODRAFT_1209589 [Penicilliopsis zonata CBS 506.65]|uniref:Uncharacterized protein n=1 Tax=Penicilliopsis zonata CBS 506.65 TaxID=1073090 RepID=A0A1L9S7E9_9EURO|nr:hypothetical protein ASPZODRAFT_1209589 [Penicilliopsis zonata CBS 506.65]OJJ43063.1 hypothetical protein ASPZODRAFT_1209589 [Penicilliopsis zonata CBS 506.65]